MIRLLRYRFFLLAGLLPYLLGAAAARFWEGTFEPLYFWAGLVGIALSVVGVECFNEYFDSRLGTDRVFAPDEEPPIGAGVLALGVAAFVLAGGVGLYLASARGWLVLLFAALGGLAAVFYVGPPIRWAYLGFGEAMIFFSYGPWMTLGSYYLQAQSLSWPAALASLVPGLLIWALAVANEIPDFYQDSLVGKRNLVVRLGRKRGVQLYTGAAAGALGVIAGGALSGAFPLGSLAALAGAPLAVRSYLRAAGAYDNPREFVPAIRSMVAVYLVSATLFTLSFLG